nr:hypothetical protein [Tanacetum cinerariifolium]
MIQPEPEGYTHGYPLVSVEVLKTLKDRGEVIIMTQQQQHVSDVHPDDMCPPNKRYDLMEANKKIDLEHLLPLYHGYTEVFRIDVPLTQSQPTESTQGTYRTPSAPRSTCLTPPTLVPTVDKADEMILQDTLQMVEGQENVIDDSSISRNDEHNIPSTREKGQIVEESRNTPFPTPIRSPRIYTDLVSLDTEKLQELTVTDTKSTQSSRVTGKLWIFFEHMRARFMPRKSFATLADHIQEVMVDLLPTMVKKHVKEQVQKQVPEQVRDQVPVYVAEGLNLERQKNKEEMEKMIAKAILQERGNIQAQISLQIHKAIANDIPF